ncbi:hypothetical protein CEXT_143441 [Caerostris extrusa]|uniref:Uncharacterized protein n=1 Tax=Caerostris extrusa TaxID=172846 RepID=A0AAV4XRQ9_CAEEX|nr:hypothetical protein CEXT_143441 [Caerostris extrusa]
MGRSVDSEMKNISDHVKHSELVSMDLRRATCLKICSAFVAGTNKSNLQSTSRKIWSGGTFFFSVFLSGFPFPSSIDGKKKAAQNGGRQTVEIQMSPDDFGCPEKKSSLGNLYISIS